MTALAEIVFVHVYNDCSIDYWLVAVEHYLGVSDCDTNFRVDHNYVSKITHMSFHITRSTMILIKRVIMSSSRPTPIRCKNTICMNMEAVYTISEAIDIATDLNLLSFSLLECNCTEWVVSTTVGW